MTESNPFLKNIRESAGFRLAILFGSFFVLMLVSSILSMAINGSGVGSERTHGLLSSIIQCLLAFCVPAFLLAKFSSHKWADWLYLTKMPPLKALLGVAIVFVISMPAMEWLIEFNNNLHLPESLKGLEETMRGWEENSEQYTKVLLESQGVLSTLAGVLVIGLLTGFSEEMFFRGGFQGIMTRTTMQAATAVWISAFLFSFMHFQFFGFLPRLLMGAFFGYLLVWTKSIWVPVFAHALNNSAVVIGAAITGDASGSLIDSETSSAVLGSNLTVIGSVIFTILFLWFCRDNLFKSNNTDNRWQKSQLPPVSES